MTQCDSRAGGRAWVCSWHTEPVRCGDCYLAQHAFPSEDTAHLASKHPWQLSQIIYSHFTPKHYHGGNAFCICRAYSKWLLIVLWDMGVTTTVSRDWYNQTGTSP